MLKCMSRTVKILMMLCSIIMHIEEISIAAYSCRTNSSARKPMLLHHLLIASRQLLTDTSQLSSAPLQGSNSVHGVTWWHAGFWCQGDFWSGRWQNFQVTNCPAFLSPRPASLILKHIVSYNLLGGTTVSRPPVLALVILKFL